ncbi:uncharacterized protein IUM83_13347 [Phytophthora cinnamomi]|uniref:uncharacterized protein n=1 Tax=Phytophthora cinnamomi TaxID=4785 RepID=UPI003559E346|nr:hypothetical protein IUM83_13347 [Phytophthora cinnamomi]
MTSSVFRSTYSGCRLSSTDAKKAFATTVFCERSSLNDAKLWHCNKIRRQYKGVNKTCFNSWHGDFDSGNITPPTLGKRVVFRRPGQRIGKRMKPTRELQLAAAGSLSNMDTSDSDDV